MHISAIPAALALAALSASTASATMIKMYIVQQVVPIVTTTLITDDGDAHNYGYFLDGCKKNYDFVQEICIDSARSRAHIFWTNQPGRKYCFVQTKNRSQICASGPGTNTVRCIDIEYTAAPCTW
ncbi:uncharacterized protein B0I36DRAFT_353111 [Microdochium trichocladiopsis]|uniref:Uncharacterized protein n=1 Tax=Microdochium trichocladiopsis TaxID=1682393 RepID=A0A9P9BPV6_9PEZI|nr:uncharacterized protein B0I36DRAFT_353111 [Microdochium trichocladiopsis]KAH7024926.1 hypothetical protein B0I36DRAFT_353111 [Microdochium trichocladiopsis]